MKVGSGRRLGRCPRGRPRTADGPQGRCAARRAPPSPRILRAPVPPYPPRRRLRNADRSTAPLCTEAVTEAGSGASRCSPRTTAAVAPPAPTGSANAPPDGGVTPAGRSKPWRETSFARLCGDRRSPLPSRRPPGHLLEGTSKLVSDFNSAKTQEVLLLRPPSCGAMCAPAAVMPTFRAYRSFSWSKTCSWSKTREGPCRFHVSGEEVLRPQVTFIGAVFRAPRVRSSGSADRGRMADGAHTTLPPSCLAADVEP